ncbi:hypothetical protein ACJVDH_15510 [Pedobacter sp. AW1-32]|uniref:hypothetical protein n=1 Tax=Pedobacter sp. AW1-32 TaxID=3383026 RepID=UPI003FEF5668
MKNFPFALAIAFSIICFSCSGEKADTANADSMYKYTDTTKVIDSNATDSASGKLLADTISNTPAGVKK